MKAAGFSDIGKVRSQNQDSIYCSTEPVGPLPNLFLVADGMGGHNAGDIASQQATAHFCEYIKSNNAETEDFLDLCVSATAYANRSLRVQSAHDAELRGMGTTFTACYILDNQCKIVHVGDSRVYMVAHKAITQLTQDHSYVNEMVKAGQITEREAREHPQRNVLLRVLGGDDTVETDAYSRILEKPCAILICSDGLHGLLTDKDILKIVNKKTAVEERARDLINAANEAGGHDNISVVLIDIA